MPGDLHLVNESRLREARLLLSELVALPEPSLELDGDAPPPADLSP